MQLTAKCETGGNRPLSAFPFAAGLMARLLAASLVAASAFIPADVSAKAFVPRDDNLVLERLPAPGDTIKRQLRVLRAKLNADPRNLELALRLSRRYIGLAREESDPRYIGYAEAALGPWWSRPEPPVAVLVLRATIRQNRHQFDAALADLDLALKQNPKDPQAWLTRAVILQVQARYQEAADSCLRLRRLSARVVVTTCMGGVLALTGRANEALDRMRLALEETPDAAKGIRLWTLTAMAETAAALGDAAMAERYFGRALDLGQRDGYLLAAYSDFLLDAGRYEEVRARLAEETRIDGLLLRLAIAERHLGAAKGQSRVDALQARFAASTMRGSRLHLRDEARFTLHLLGQPGAALRLALTNWKVQREPADARILLEAAIAANKPQAAAPVLAWIQMTGVEHAVIRALARKIEGMPA